MLAPFSSCLPLKATETGGVDPARIYRTWHSTFSNISTRRSDMAAFGRIGGAGAAAAASCCAT